ncbi:MAG: methyltransferase family protein [Promethearchaeota archaeon]|jgi:protein-S-isoprenylcysteine O-methyltransferase Ste14
MARSLLVGRVQVGLLALALGAVVHLLLPAALVFGAYGLDRLLGKSLSWVLWVRLPLGAVLFILSVALEGATLPHFIRAGGLPSPLTPTESLVVTGPYRYCRNPICIAYIGYVVGPGIMLGLRSSFLVAALYCLCLVMVTKFFEEPQLRRRFGEQFELYRRTTPFMIPRFRPHR